jgi:hypothetical protein
MIHGPGLINQVLQQLRVVYGDTSSNLIEADKCVFVISHVKRGEESVHEVLEVMVTGMYEELLSLFGEVTHIEELHVVLVDTHVTDEVTHLTERGLVQVGQETMLKLRVVNFFGVVSDLVINGDLESGLVSKDVLELRLINRHALLISVVELSALKAISVLSIEVFLLTKFS